MSVNNLKTSNQKCDYRNVTLFNIDFDQIVLKSLILPVINCSKCDQRLFILLHALNIIQ